MSNCVVVWNELTNEIELFSENEQEADEYISDSENPSILYKVKEHYADWCIK